VLTSLGALFGRAAPAYRRVARVAARGLIGAALITTSSVPVARGAAGETRGPAPAAAITPAPAASPAPSLTPSPAPPASPAPTPDRGLDPIGRSLVKMAEATVDPPTPAPTPVCVLVCPKTPAPEPESTPNPMAAASFRLHVPIFEYHRIKPWEGETGYTRDLITPPEIFAAQMDAMAAAGWRTMTLGDLAEDLRFGITPPPKTFVVTIDDGYKDGYQNAMPILVAHGFVATYFVIAERIGWASFLSPFELRALVASGMEIGNHSYSHGDVAAVPPDQLVKEINGASAIIASDTGIWPRTFAYPRGFGSGMVVAQLEACPGLSAAVIQGGSKPEIWNNRWQLPRIRVGAGIYPAELVARASLFARG
jgi:peptidoglycan/xylan/chitin deacetylase (PgdA/CDA1 family)